MAEVICKRCGEPEREHIYHPIKNPNKAGTKAGSRCKGFVDPRQVELGAVPNQGRPSSQLQTKE